jgi:FkbM family methyltransferase
LREGDVFIDIGAHVGYYALKAWRLVGRRGLIIAFEPSLAQFGSLSANLLRNRCETILAVSCALGDSLGQGFLYQASHENVGATSIRPQAGCPRFAVLIARLDDVLPQDLWSRVRLIKIDVEGWESSVLKGMRKLLATAPVPAIIMEIREKFLRQTGTSAAEVVGYLQGLGYRGRAVTSEGRGQNAFAPLPDFPGEDVSADVLFLRGSEGERIALDLGMDLSLGEEGAGSA